MLLGLLAMDGETPLQWTLLKTGAEAKLKIFCMTESLRLYSANLGALTV